MNSNRSGFAGFRKLALVPVLATMLCAPSFATSFTITSPTAEGTLPAGVTQIGGIVLDAVGLNGNRLVAQLSAASLFSGFAGTNPFTIGTQTGLTAAVLSQLGGGFSELAVRITLFDGDSAAGDFDFNNNTFLLNGYNAGNWSAVTTQNTDATGTVAGSFSTGFRDNVLDTGFFYLSAGATLTNVYNSIVSSGQLAYGVNDTDPGDNFYDFTQGVSGGLINVETAPVITPPSVPDAGGTLALLSASFGGVAMLRRRFFR
jgi:hypothetical protein